MPLPIDPQPGDPLSIAGMRRKLAQIDASLRGQLATLHHESGRALEAVSTGGGYAGSNIIRNHVEVDALLIEREHLSHWLQTWDSLDVAKRPAVTP